MTKKILLSFIFISFGFYNLIGQPLTAKAFRDNASEKAGTATDKVFDTEAWAFYSGGAIRSTPLLVNNKIYFGNAIGEFFCIDKLTGKKVWAYHTGSPIHSSASFLNGLIFFADKKQKLYALSANDGKLVWEFSFSKNKSYEWQFDYFLSSPTIYNNQIFIGSADGNVYCIQAQSGKEVWHYSTDCMIRSTPAVSAKYVYAGDVNGKMHCLDKATGKLQWTFSTLGDSLNNNDFGYDRKAIISSPAIKDNMLIFGSRDGFMYCINTITGEKIWAFDYQITWVISSPCIYKNLAIAGTSDGRFINAIDIYTGKEKWRTATNQIIWSSPAVVGDAVYAGGFDGLLYCLDASTGKRLVAGFMSNANILSSAVSDGNFLYVGSDDGNIYALKGSPKPKQPINTIDSNFVYQKNDPPFRSFRTGSDITLTETLRRRGFTTCKNDTLLSAIMQRTITDHFKRRIVFATNYFPPLILEGNKNSLMRRFLDAGGEVIILAMNFSFFKLLPEGYSLENFKAAEEIFDIHFMYEDTRAIKGSYPSTVTDAGRKLHIRPYSNTLASVNISDVNIVYAVNEIGDASSWTKFYNNGGSFTQLWIDEFHDPEKSFETIYMLTEKR